MADQALEGWLSPLLRRRRIGAALPHLRGRVLDFGCGSGALAAFIPPDRYLGFDVDAASLAAAHRLFPQHRFTADLPPEPAFDTVVALAVIEHVPDAGLFLRQLAANLAPGPAAAVVCTTPHPALGWVHALGARLGLFSRHASEEHHALLGRPRLRACADAAGLKLALYRRFLCGANQLAIFQPTEAP